MSSGPRAEDGAGWAGPLFLERQSYRQRRLRDAARFLPVLMMVLWLVPLMWTGDGDAAGSGLRTGQVILYVFGVWFLSILGSLLLTLPLRRETGPAPRPRETEPRA